MSNSTIITNNPADTCPRVLGWKVPSAWSDSTSSNYSQAACAVPACNNFPSTLADCCGRANSDLEYFNTTLGPYASCALAKGTDSETYQAFQTCLANKEVAYFKCNGQNGGKNNECASGISAAPLNNTDLANLQTCSMSASVNATRAMKNCCSNYDDGLLVYADGCPIGCVSKSTDGAFLDCITSSFKNYTGLLCTDNKAKSGTSAGARASPSLAGIFTILVLGSSMLML
jgi:hypothetical protein